MTKQVLQKQEWVFCSSWGGLTVMRSKTEMKQGLFSDLQPAQFTSAKYLLEFLITDQCIDSFPQ